MPAGPKGQQKRARSSLPTGDARLMYCSPSTTIESFLVSRKTYWTYSRCLTQPTSTSIHLGWTANSTVPPTSTDVPARYQRSVRTAESRYLKDRSERQSVGQVG